MLIIPTDALWALLERALRREATGAAGSGTFRKQMLTSREMPCRQAEAAGRSVPKRSLTGRRRPLAPPRLRKTILVGVRRSSTLSVLFQRFCQRGSLPISGSNQTPGPSGSSTPS